MSLSKNLFLVFLLMASCALEIPASNPNVLFNPVPFETTPTQPPPPASEVPLPRALLTHTDEYIIQNQRKCMETRQLVSCIKYKASRLIWKLATNSLGYFPNEYARGLEEDKRRIRIVQLGEPSTEVTTLFKDARSLQGNSSFFTTLGK